MVFPIIINEQEIVGLVGESGCGKSVSQLSVMQLISSPGKIVGGKYIFEGQDLLKYEVNGAEMRSITGSKNRNDISGTHDLALILY